MKTRLLLLVLILVCLASSTRAQQIADPEFDIHVAKPAYTKNYPRVLFDEAHNNFHTTTGRYKPFADLMVNDGYNVVRGRKTFAKPSLSTFKILVIANALGVDDMDDEGADTPAFTEQECDAVRDWVKDGGALLLIADHAPFGAAAENLGKRFGVDMNKGFTYDSENSLKEFGPSVLIYSRENKSLGDHPITRGRNDVEKINRVIAFTGQSLKGPENSTPLLILADTATDRPDRESDKSVSAAGRAQALAFKFGKGRVVIMGEAAMLSAQLAGAENRPMGMNVPGSDNRQLALNIMHWLSGLL
ncbi:MAG TPA: DUF4350 domain-containing protein [Pyrinomonadaceae bacterium]|nr:DUF4350 domain-containing protein [Pyrinomonadaceae bacterium]